MKLSPADADRFFKLTWGLHYYVNHQLQLIPAINSVEDYADLPLEEKLPVREALYANLELFDRFVADNPLVFSDEELAIVLTWKHFVEGEFYIERTLKKYAIFIGPENMVYGVLGLYEGLTEMFPKNRLPLLVRAVLLPFQGKIVYDGLFQGTNFFFGSGIKEELKQVYLLAKESGLIVEDLLADKPAESMIAAKKKAAAKTNPEFNELLQVMTEQAKTLRGGKGQPAFNGPIFSLIKASLNLGLMAVEQPGNQPQLMKSLDKVEQAYLKAEKSLYRYL